MNTSELHDGINNSRSVTFSSDPPPGAVWGWPGCSYPLPMPPRSMYAQLTEWIWRTVPLVLILLGTVGNILTALVIFRNFRNIPSTAVYLLSLAFTDTLFLYNAPLRRVILHVFELEVRSFSNLGCKVSVFLTYASFHISAWILVAVTIERVVSVIWPFKVKRCCTERSAIVVTSAIVALVCVMDSHILYGFSLSPLPIYQGVGECNPAYEDYSMFYNYQWVWIHFVCGFAVPFCFILIGNTLVIHGLRRMRKRQRWMYDETDSGRKPHVHPHGHNGHHTKTLMIILILLNTIFFISQTPLAIYLVYFPYVVSDLNQVACSDVSIYMEGAEKLWFWESVTHNFAYFNASINFVLYVVSGSRFRKEIVSLLMCRQEFRIQSTSSVCVGSGRRHRENQNNAYHVKMTPDRS